MANVKAFVRTQKESKNVCVRFRIYEGRKVDMSIKSNISVDSSMWDNSKEALKQGSTTPISRNRIAYRINTWKAAIMQAFEELRQSPEEITSQNLSIYVDRVLNPDKYKGAAMFSSNMDFEQTFNYFIETTKVCHSRKNLFRIVLSTLFRFEQWKQNMNAKFKLSLDSIDAQLLNEIEYYMSNEYSLYGQYMQYGNTKCAPREKGLNTIITRMNALRTFFLWARKMKMTNNYSFENYSVKQETYGTPFYMTIEERNKLLVFSLEKEQEVQRDIFVFQCCIGCRYGDLIKLTKSSVINDSIEYIASKTVKGSGRVITVPLNNVARTILQKYKGFESEKLLPFMSVAQYNNLIKIIFEKAGIDRLVTILNPVTRKTEQKPLYMVASSHLARRTFIGNLYKQVQDPNMIASMSGHVDGSKAFARYRTIDEQMKVKLVALLE